MTDGSSGSERLVDRLDGAGGPATDGGAAAVGQNAAGQQLPGFRGGAAPWFGAGGGGHRGGVGGVGGYGGQHQGANPMAGWQWQPATPAWSAGGQWGRQPPAMQSFGMGMQGGRLPPRTVDSRLAYGSYDAFASGGGRGWGDWQRTQPWQRQSWQQRAARQPSNARAGTGGAAAGEQGAGDAPGDERGADVGADGGAERAGFDSAAEIAALVDDRPAPVAEAYRDVVGREVNDWQEQTAGESSEPGNVSDPFDDPREGTPTPGDRSIAEWAAEEGATRVSFEVAIGPDEYDNPDEIPDEEIERASVRATPDDGLEVYGFADTEGEDWEDYQAVTGGGGSVAVSFGSIGGKAEIEGDGLLSLVSDRIPSASELAGGVGGGRDGPTAAADGSGPSNDMQSEENPFSRDGTDGGRGI